MVSEKVGGAEGTKLDEDFLTMEKVSNTLLNAVFDIRYVYVLKVHKVL